MINNPSVDPSSKTTRIGRAIWTALQTQSSNHAKNFITKIVKEENARALEAGQDITKFAVGVCVKVYILSNMFITLILGLCNFSAISSSELALKC